MSHVTLQTMDGAETQLDDAVVNELSGQLRGDMCRPGEPGYDEARTIWNGMIDRQPGLAVRCLGTADVMTAVRFARANDLLVTVKGGGHNIAGLAVRDGALLLDTSRMRGVWVDREARLAHAQAGCTLGDVDRETQLHGLAAVLGFVSNTGTAGLTLGGGFGYLTRAHGWTCDNVREMELVTADGQLVRASDSENADLFWALRGGGGNFGIVTRFTYELYPVGPEVMAGAVAWRADEAPAVLDLCRRVQAEAPPELAVVGVLRKAPPAPWIDETAHGQLVAMLLYCHTGDLENGRRLAEPIKSFGDPVGDVLQPRPYTQQQALLDATQPFGRRYYWKSDYMPPLSSAMNDVMLQQATKIGSPHSAILIFPLDGALNLLPEDHSPVGNRDTSIVINIAAAWDDAGEDGQHIAWARETWEALRPHSTGGTYINFQTEDEGEARTRQAYGQNYERLRELKRAWDPDNFFRSNKNIEP